MKWGLLFLALTLSTEAFATRARLRALQQDPNGSYYISDTRNIFLNPAQIAILKDNANFEWGQSERSGTQDKDADAEGGFVMELGEGKLGAQIGRVNRFSRTIRFVNDAMPDLGAAIVGGTFAEGQNSVDVVYGGGDALRWGAGLAFTRSSLAVAPGVEADTQALEFRGGFNTDRWEAFGSILLGAQTETEVAGTTGQLQEDAGISAGGGLQLNPNMRVFGRLAYDPFEVQRKDDTAEYDGRGFDMGAGFVNFRNFESNGRFFTAIEFSYLSVKANDKKPTNVDEEFSRFAVPLSLGVEADAREWLRMRASVRQNVVVGRIKSTSGTATSSLKYDNAPNDTSVAFGASASFNRFNFDAALVQVVGSDNGRAEASMTYLF